MSARFTITLSDKTFARVQNYCRQERRTDRVDACRLLIEDALDEWENSQGLERESAARARLEAMK